MTQKELSEKFKDLYAKISKRYLFSLIDPETLSEIRNWSLRPLTMFIGSFVLLIMVIISTATLIITTPIKEKIPGYTDPQLERDYKSQQKIVIELESKIEQRDSLLSSLLSAFGTKNTENTPISQIMIANNEMVEKNNQEFEGNGDPMEESPQSDKEEASSSIPKFASNPTRKTINYFVAPLEGFITEAYKPEEKHFGVDVVADEKTIIQAIADGVVIFSEYSSQTGYVLAISHGEMISFYKHNSKVFKNVGSFVRAGEGIAVIGNSGENSTGMHLHFELWENGQTVNPVDYIKFN